MTDRPRVPANPTDCAACGALLAGDQRWCLECGTRRAGSAQPFAEALAPAGSVDGAEQRSAGAPRAAAIAWRRLATPRPLTVAVVGVFVCGLGLGAALGPPAPDSIAAGSAPIIVARAPAPAAATGPSTDGDTGAGDLGSLPSDLPAGDPVVTDTTAADGYDPGYSSSDTTTNDPSTPEDTSGTDDGTDEDPTPASTLPAVGHVFTIVLGGAGYNATFAPDSPATYLNTTLAKKGQTLEEYYAVAHEGLANHIAMISGQPPTAETQADCPIFTDLTPARLDDQQAAEGAGCVYPTNVPNLADQLATIAYRWKAYAQDAEKPGATAPAAASAPASSTCRHPADGARDPTAVERPGDGFATSNVPFLYFRSVIDGPDCANSVVALDQLTDDLGSAKTTPDYSLIVPDLCDGGWAKPCLDGRPGGLAQADAFLATWVPKILASSAFKQDGLLVVTFDQAPSSGDDADSRACCASRRPGPNVKDAGGAATPGPGGGRVGAVVVSRFVKGGTTNATPYDHYSLLASVEDLFGLGRLGYAGLSGVKAFGRDVFTTTAK